MNKRGVAIMSLAHVVDDSYQGAVPALLPFFVAERHYSYAAVSGLTLAATLLSSVAQPAFGWWTDRRPRRWLIGAGILTAAAGVGLAGLFANYAITWFVIALSGLGIAAFHPSAARAARQAAGNSNRAMSVFAVGGNAGFALGSLIATPVLLVVGLRGTVLLVLPAVAMVTILAARLTSTLDGPSGGRRSLLPTGEDDWPAFVRLTTVVVVRAVVFFGLTSFLALYFIHGLHTSKAVGGAALSTLLVAGAVGTLLGGWLADRAGRLITIRTGLACAIPAIAGLVLVSSVPVAFVFATLVGIALYMPFSVFVMLGQDYLPNRIGTASGVTVGLAVSVGGLFSPLLGWLADSTSLRLTIAVLMVLPALGLLLSLPMHEPVGHAGPIGDDAAAAIGDAAETADSAGVLGPDADRSR
ncbi:MFS transporter [Jatrophihabitans cynanchi]|uniref:MFS transporter n=1 Tax=Jatrophihabitans cynanchi TaxID=2944128 RepID=A0ABY7K3W3_9ACTN|nr:MFS transporter [Jatrophihabitans sp. SB3-54]WAX59178.1 MFS transporter [Jatrophihabitans sp. SB3-54]